MSARGFSRSGWASLLLPVSWVYAAAASGRRARASRQPQRVEVPVLSVGNITCGGTGKTPAVEMVVRLLLARRRKPAILSRGYRAGPTGLNDEAQLLRQNLPGVPHHVGADRAASARAAIAAGADVLVLDDGFQHARLARDLDLVLVDALDPFGGGRVLPAGLLREPLAALARADLIAITRGALVSPAQLGILRGLLRDRFPGIPRLEIETEARCWVPVGGGAGLAPRALAGKRVAAFAGIGNPEAFRRQLLALGAELVSWTEFPDHHRYRPRDLDELKWRAREAGAAAVATTQKDAVKIPAGGVIRPDLPPGGTSVPGAAPWFALHIASRPGRGGEELERALDRALAPHGGGA